MEVWEVFNQGLTITGVGMGLVFLTPIIIAGLIWLLQSLSRPGAGRGEEEAAEEETWRVRRHALPCGDGV